MEMVRVGFEVGAVLAQFLSLRSIRLIRVRRLAAALAPSGR